MAWPTARSIVPRSHPGTIALAAAAAAMTAAVRTITIRKRLLLVVMRRAARSHHATVATAFRAAWEGIFQTRRAAGVVRRGGPSWPA
jgi:hypothetical protein